MLDYNSPASLAAFLDSRGLAMQKKFGQNFLINGRARAALTDALEIDGPDGPPPGGVWEVGPGLGAMTREILARGANVSALEIDRGFCEALEELFAGQTGFSLIRGDALRLFGKAPLNDASGVYLFGNLPYNIAAKLLGCCMERGLYFPRVVVTVQKEVAARIAAKPGGADYSSLSVLTSYFYNVKPLSVLKGESFYPVPRVDSQALRLDLKPGVKAPPAAFRTLIRALFASRRKTVRNNLAALLQTPPAEAEELLLRAGISPSLRAERLAPEDFLRLASECKAHLEGTVS